MDSVFIEKIITIRDSFENKIYIEAPCDTNGILKDGYKQEFQHGKTNVQFQIKDNQIRLNVKSNRDSAISKEQNRLVQKDSVQKEFKDKKETVKERVVVKKTFWDKVLDTLGYILYIPIIIVVYELIRFFVPVLKRK